MSTVIESLVIELGLDPKKLSDGQRKALSDWKKFQEESRKGAVGIEENNKKAAESFSGLGRQVLGALAVFTAGKGIKDFVEWQTKVNVLAGRMSANLNIGVKQIFGWQAANERAGGTAEGVANSFQNFSDQIQNLKATGEASFLPFLRALEAGSGKQINLNKPLIDTYVDMAEALKVLGETDRTQAIWLGKQILGDEALVTTMLEKGRAIKDLTERQSDNYSATQKDIEASKELMASWSDASKSATSFGRSILTSLTPALSQLLGLSKNFLDNTKDKDGNFGSFGKWLGKVFLGSNASQDTAGSASPSSSGGGAFKSQSEKEAFIRAEAIARGINPDVAMKVARAEGFNSFNSSIPGEKSYGAFQLNISKNPNKPSLGDLFKRQTGKDPSDPATEREGIKFALDNVAKSGWGQWYGARAVGVGNFDGIGGARTAAAGRAGGGGNTEVNIGTIKIETQAKDADGIARDIRPALERNSLIANANYGPQ